VRVNVIGLGKLGLVLAALYAEAGHRVVGIDQSEKLVSSLNKGSFSSPEPGLNELLASVADNIVFTESYAMASDAAVSFIVVPTPSLPSGAYSLEYMLSACESLGNMIALSSAAQHHLVVIVSTVNPTDTAKHITPALLGFSKRTRSGLGIVYSPEFIALGDVIEGMRNPEFVLAGSDHNSDLERYYAIASTVSNGAPFMSTTPSNAELAKIAINSFITMKVSFANMIGGLCEGFEGGNADAVLQIVGADKRIGSAYLKTGGPYGGPCFPRDNRALSFFADDMAELCDAADKENDETYLRIYRRINELLRDGDFNHLQIIGTTYKPNTTVQEHALGAQLYLENYGDSVSVTCWDPLLDPEWEPQYDARSLVVLATPNPAFQSLPLTAAGCVLDVWGVFDTPTWRMVRLGRG
jgi:UDPglucose 6-dehydrogenase